MKRRLLLLSCLGLLFAARSDSLAQPSSWALAETQHGGFPKSNEPRGYAGRSFSERKRVRQGATGKLSCIAGGVVVVVVGAKLHSLYRDSSYLKWLAKREDVKIVGGTVVLENANPFEIRIEKEGKKKEKGSRLIFPTFPINWKESTIDVEGTIKSMNDNADKLNDLKSHPEYIWPYFVSFRLLDRKRILKDPKLIKLLYVHQRDFYEEELTDEELVKTVQAWGEELTYFHCTRKFKDNLVPILKGKRIAVAWSGAYPGAFVSLGSPAQGYGDYMFVLAGLEKENLPLSHVVGSQYWAGFWEDIDLQESLRIVVLPDVVACPDVGEEEEEEKEKEEEEKSEEEKKEEEEKKRKERRIKKVQKLLLELGYNKEGEAERVRVCLRSEIENKLERFPPPTIVPRFWLGAGKQNSNYFCIKTAEGEIKFADWYSGSGQLYNNKPMKFFRP